MHRACTAEDEGVTRKQAIQLWYGSAVATRVHAVGSMYQETHSLLYYSLAIATSGHSGQVRVKLPAMQRVELV